MRLKTATGYGTSEITILLPMPKREATGLALPDDRAFAGRQQTAAMATPPLGATSTTSTLLSLGADMRREAQNELWALAVLWTAAWTALALVCA